MADTEWGKCKDCKWFQIEPRVKAANNTMGLCIEENLQRFRLRVSGNSGCTPLHVLCSRPRPGVELRTARGHGDPIGMTGLLAARSRTRHGTSFAYLDLLPRCGTRVPNRWRFL
jgi:hypothetical protein